ILKRLDRARQLLCHAKAHLILRESNVPGEQEEVRIPLDGDALDRLNFFWPRLESGRQPSADVALRLLLVERLELVLPLVAEDQPRQVALRIGIDHHDAMALGSQHPTKLECRRRLTDAALVVEPSNALPLPAGRLNRGVLRSG